jgi:predicted amidohydrolase
MTCDDTLGVVLVQPSRWDADGLVNLTAAHDALIDLGPLDDSHVVVLPELVGATLPEPDYLAGLRRLASTSRAWIIGGSHHAAAPVTNSGIVLAPDGTVVARYHKRNPYGVEHDHGIRSGDCDTTARIAGHDVAVLLCADAWFAELLLDAPVAADLVVVPSFTITRRPPAFARALWSHLAIARAYEFTTFVALAHWPLGTDYYGAPSAGTSGVADPAPDHPDGYFTPAAETVTSVHHLDLERLRRHRADRAARRFIRTRPQAPPSRTVDAARPETRAVRAAPDASVVTPARGKPGRPGPGEQRGPTGSRP